MLVSVVIVLMLLSSYPAVASTEDLIVPNILSLTQEIELKFVDEQPKGHFGPKRMLQQAPLLLLAG